MRAIVAFVALIALPAGGCGRVSFDAFERGDGGTINGDAPPDGPRRELIEQFVASTGDGSFYGQSVAVSGDGLRCVVGALGFDSFRGTVKVWRYDGDLGWSPESSFLAADVSDLNDQFGYRVAIDGSGTRIVVGAPLEDSGDVANPGDNATQDAGAAYVFERAGTAWVQVGYLKATNADAFDYFGTSVAISADGTTIAVGAINEDGGAMGLDGNAADNSAVDAGAAYVFKQGPTTWNQFRYVKQSTSQPDQWFGTSVALSADGSVIAVGASHESSSATGVDGNQLDTSATLAGAAYVIDLTSGATTYLKASNTDTGDFFGESVSLSGDGTRLLVGAPGEDSNSANVNGAQDEGANSAGAAYLFERDAGGWAQVAFMKASNPGTGDELGGSVSLSADGGTAVVGAFREDGGAMGRDGAGDEGVMDSGAAYQFTRMSGAWVPGGYLKATDPAVGDNFGTAVAVSSDGHGIANGAPRRGSEAGSVYFYLSLPE